MKRMILLSMVCVVALGVYVLAQPAADVPKPPKGMMTRCMGMMRKAGMAPATMKRMRVMMQTPIFMDSPYAIYGQAAALKLSDEQKASLVKIENEARRKALAVLTPGQRKKMGDIPSKPTTMMQMCRQMRAKMMPKMTGGKGGTTKMCPVMKMTGGSACRATTKPTK